MLKVLFAIFPIFLYVKPLSVLIILIQKIYTSPGLIKYIVNFVPLRQCINISKYCHFSRFRVICSTRHTIPKGQRKLLGHHFNFFVIRQSMKNL